jgi:uncharacterized SAM-binding protein YcdF (DUF218 family)
VEQRKKRLVRHVARTIIAISVSFGAAMLGGWPVYVAPQVDALRPADAILVLGGDGARRYPLGLELAQQGWAPTVVWSVGAGTQGEWMRKACASPPVGITLRCVTAGPQTTRGEGQALRRLAAEYGWRTVIVVTYAPHISRARFILHRCFGGEIIMVESSARISTIEWMKQYLYQTAGYAKALVGPAC